MSNMKPETTYIICNICHQPILESKMFLHEGCCSRNNVFCQHCKKVFLKEEYEKHINDIFYNSNKNKSNSEESKKEKPKGTDKIQNNKVEKKNPKNEFIQMPMVEQHKINNPIVISDGGIIQNNNKNDYLFPFFGIKTSENNDKMSNIKEYFENNVNLKKKDSLKESNSSPSYYNNFKFKNDLDKNKNNSVTINKIEVDTNLYNYDNINYKPNNGQIDISNENNMFKVEEDKIYSTNNINYNNNKLLYQNNSVSFTDNNLTKEKLDKHKEKLNNIIGDSLNKNNNITIDGKDTNKINIENKHNNNIIINNNIITYNSNSNINKINNIFNGNEKQLQKPTMSDNIDIDNINRKLVLKIKSKTDENNLKYNSTKKSNKKEVDNLNNKFKNNSTSNKEEKKSDKKKQDDLKLKNTFQNFQFTSYIMEDKPEIIDMKQKNQSVDMKNNKICEFCNNFVEDLVGHYQYYHLKNINGILAPRKRDTEILNEKLNEGSTDEVGIDEYKKKILHREFKFNVQALSKLNEGPNPLISSEYFIKNRPFIKPLKNKTMATMKLFDNVIKYRRKDENKYKRINRTQEKKKVRTFMKLNSERNIRIEYNCKTNSMKSLFSTNSKIKKGMFNFGNNKKYNPLYFYSEKRNYDKKNLEKKFLII